MEEKNSVIFVSLFQFELFFFFAFGQIFQGKHFNIQICDWTERMGQRERLKKKNIRTKDLYFQFDFCFLEKLQSKKKKRSPFCWADHVHGLSPILLAFSGFNYFIPFEFFSVIQKCEFYLILFTW